MDTNSAINVRWPNTVRMLTPNNCRFWIRLYAKIVTKPRATFSVLFLIVAAFGFLPKTKEVVFFFCLTFPWLLLFILFLNMPLYVFLFRREPLHEEEKINHALEHGTIYFLRKYYAGERRIGGRAEKQGFRVCGVETKDDIQLAFEELREHIKKGELGIVLSRSCGSNIPTIQGVALILLAATFVIFAAFELDKTIVCLILLGNILLYRLLRFPIAKYFQKQETMSFSFSDAEIVEINKTKKKGLWEISPVYFVHTRVRNRI